MTLTDSFNTSVGVMFDDSDSVLVSFSPSVRVKFDDV